MKPVGVLSKVLKIFDLLHQASEGLTMTEISEQTGINISTCYRFLAQLEQEGYLVRGGKGIYILGPRLLRLAATYDHGLGLRELCRPELRELWQTTKETVNLAVLDGSSIVYVDVLESPHEFRLVSTIGMRRPVYCTALGKALLAVLAEDKLEQLLRTLRFDPMTKHTITNADTLLKELRSIRRRGFSLDDEEAVLGACCVGAAVLNSRGEGVAAISVAAPVTRIPKEYVSTLGIAVKEAARKISERMGFSGRLVRPARSSNFGLLKTP